MNEQMKITLGGLLGVVALVCVLMLLVFTYKLPKIGKIAFAMAMIACVVAQLTIKYCL